MHHYYRAHGLCIRSEIEVPFAAPCTAAEPDLRVRMGAVPESLSGSTRTMGRWQAAPGRALLNVDGVARYLIRNQGTEVVVAPAQGGDGAVGEFLVGPVLGVCLQKRGRLTLHASAIETDRGAVLFAGDRGDGKSTLLAALLNRGYRMVSDDVAAIALDADKRPEVFGALPHVRLWAEAMERLGWNGDRRVLNDVDGKRRKWRMPVERFRDAPLTVDTIFLLSNHDRDDIMIEPVAPSAAPAMLSRHTYRRRLVPVLGLERTHFRMVVATARHGRVVRIRRPAAGFALDPLADRILEHLGERGRPKRTRRNPAFRCHRGSSSSS